MPLEPHGRATADGRHQQQSPKSWSIARGTSDERQAAATSGGATTAANTHANSSALFNGAALLLEAATRAGGSSIHGLVDPIMPTHTTITSKQEEAMTSKAKVMNKNVPHTTTMNFGNPTGAAIMLDGSPQHHDCHGMLVGSSGGPSSNKSSSNANGQLYAMVHPGFWRMEGKGTANILVKIRMKDAIATKKPLISANANANVNANANPELYATLPPGFWKAKGKNMATSSTKVRVKIQKKDATKKSLAPSKKKATGTKTTTKTKKKDKDLPAGVRRKDDKYMVSVCLPGIGGSRTIAAFATKETAIEALNYANAKVQDIRMELGRQKLETKRERDAKLSEVKAHVTESITNKILVGTTPPPSATATNSTATKLDGMGANPTRVSEVSHNYRSPPKSTPPTLISTRLPAKKRANQVLHDMSAEEALERANQDPQNADCPRSKKSKADEKSLPLKKRRLIVFEASPPKKNHEGVQEQVDEYRQKQKKQQKEVQIQPAAKEGMEVNHWTRPSPQLSAPSQSFMTDQAMKLRSTLNELISKGVIEWRPSGLSFIIKKPDFLRASDFTSLSAWGFDQIRGGDDLGAIIHPNYRRDQPTLPLLPTRRSAKTNYCLSIAQDRYGSGTFLDVVIPRRSVSNPSSSFGIDLTYDADGWTRLHTRTGQHGWLRDGDIIHAVNGEKMFLPNSLLFSPAHQQKPMLHAIVVMACRRTPPGMPLTLRLFRENKSAVTISI